METFLYIFAGIILFSLGFWFRHQFEMIELKPSSILRRILRQAVQEIDENAEEHEEDFDYTTPTSGIG